MNTRSNEISAIETMEQLEHVAQALPSQEHHSRKAWMGGEGGAIYSHVAIQLTPRLLENVTDTSIEAVLASHAGNPRTNFGQMGYRPEVCESLSAIALAADIAKEARSPYRSSVMADVALMRMLEPGQAAKLVSPSTSFHSRTKEHTFAGEPLAVLLEAIPTQLYFPLNLLAFATSQLPEGYFPSIHTLDDISTTMRSSWFQLLVAEAAGTGNGTWGEQTTLIIATEGGNLRACPDWLRFDYQTDETGQLSFRFAASTSQHLKTMRAVQNEYAQRNRQAAKGNRDSIHKYRETSETGTTNGCPAGKFVFQLKDPAAAKEAAWILGTSVEAVHARLENTAINVCLSATSDLIERASRLQSAGLSEQER